MSHLLGAAAFALLGGRLLQQGGGSRLRFAALAVYVTGVVTALSVSGTFHLTPHEAPLRGVLVRLDHAAIFFLIAASYTPVHVFEFEGWRRWGILAAVWLAAAGGMALKLGFYDAVPEWVSLLLYLGLGWAGIVSAWMLYRRHGARPLLPLVLGAAAYTAGAVLDFARVPNIVNGIVGPHEVFHLFVLAGVAAHWIYMHNISRYAMATARGFSRRSDCG